jgi:hypothetical protein
MPQPIDLQTELGRTMAAERIQDASARATLLAQQRAQSEDDKVRLMQQTQVGQTPQTDSREVREKEEPGEGRERGRKRKPAAASPPAQPRVQSPRKALEPGAQHGFDVSV